MVGLNRCSAAPPQLPAAHAASLPAGCKATAFNSPHLGLAGEVVPQAAGQHRAHVGGGGRHRHDAAEGTPAPGAQQLAGQQAKAASPHAALRLPSVPLRPPQDPTCPSAGSCAARGTARRSRRAPGAACCPAPSPCPARPAGAEGGWSGEKEAQQVGRGAGGAVVRPERRQASRLRCSGGVAAIIDSGAAALPQGIRNRPHPQPQALHISRSRTLTPRLLPSAPSPQPAQPAQPQPTLRSPHFLCSTASQKGTGGSSSQLSCALPSGPRMSTGVANS